MPKRTLPRRSGSVRRRRSISAHQCRGEFELGIGEFDRAVADYTETIRHNHKMAETKDVSGYGGRAHAAQPSRRDRPRFGGLRTQALRINPNATWILCYRGFAHGRKGQWDRAVADFDEEAKRQPTRKSGLLTAKACCLALAGHDADQAVATFDQTSKGDEGFLRAIFASRAFYLDRPRSLRGSHQEPESRGKPRLAA